MNRRRGAQTPPDSESSSAPPSSGPDAADAERFPGPGAVRAGGQDDGRGPTGPTGPAAGHQARGPADLVRDPRFAGL